MQKISQYLYPNRIELLADLATFNVEFTNVYQRNLKIYKGIDNTIEFDVKNADQKRVDLTTLTNLKLNVMDAMGKKLPNSPYTVTATANKGIATVTIPDTDLAALDTQYLKYSVTCLKAGVDTILYADTRFGAVGVLELAGDAIPVTRPSRVYDTFTAEIDLDGFPISMSSAIPTTFYEATKTNTLTFEIHYTGFKGKIWIEGTTNTTINAEAFKPVVKLHEFSELLSATTGTFTQMMTVGDYKYFRVRYQNAKQSDVTSLNPSGLTGTVDKIIVS